MTSACYNLTAVQIEDFRRNGFLELGAVLSEQDRVELAKAYDYIIGRVTTLRVGIDCLDVCIADGYVWVHSPEMSIATFAEHPLCAYGRDIASRLMLTDGSAVRSSLRLFHKPALRGRPTPLHQDEAYRSPEYSWQGVSIWTTLDPATPDSGAMRFVAGSHEGGLLEHHVVAYQESRGLALEVNGADTLAATSISVDAGDATAHHIRTVHGAHANCSSLPRRAIVVVCDLRGPRRLERNNYESHDFTGREWFK